MRIGLVTLPAALIAALSIAGCQGVGERPEIAYSTLPTREVHAVYPVEFTRLHATCQSVLRQSMDFPSVSSTKDDAAGTGRIDAQAADGASVRIETRRTRSLESTTAVTVLAVKAGAAEASAEWAREVLQQIENSLWPGAQ